MAQFGPTPGHIGQHWDNMRQVTPKPASFTLRGRFARSFQFGAWAYVYSYKPLRRAPPRSGAWARSRFGGVRPDLADRVGIPQIGSVAEKCVGQLEYGRSRSFERSFSDEKMAEQTSGGPWTTIRVDIPQRFPRATPRRRPILQAGRHGRRGTRENDILSRIGAVGTRFHPNPSPQRQSRVTFPTVPPRSTHHMESVADVREAKTCRGGLRSTES